MEDVKEHRASNNHFITYFMVSILVLMEDVKEPPQKYMIDLNPKCVSILVLMEDVKEQENRTFATVEDFCFNPCFNGRCKRTQQKHVRFHLIGWFQSLF